MADSGEAMTGAPRVDVVIPCYNYARYLGGCVRSVLEQVGVRVRILIIDDCSTDETDLVGRALAQRHDEVEFVRHAKNKGHIATYNEGLLEWAAGDYTLLLSADDLLVPGMLHRATSAMSASPEIAFCFGEQVVFFDGTDPVLPDAPASPPPQIMTGAEFIRMACSTAGNPVATPTVVVRDSFQKAAGGYSRELPHTGDLEMWLRLASLGSVARLGALQACKRHHSSNMVQTYVAGILPDLRQRWNAFDRGLAPGGRGEADRLRGQVRVTLAEQAIWGAHEAFDRGDESLLEELLAFARQLDPQCDVKGGWRSLSWKRRIGHRMWPLLNPAVEAVRRWI